MLGASSIWVDGEAHIRAAQGRCHRVKFTLRREEAAHSACPVSTRPEDHKGAPLSDELFMSHVTATQVTEKRRQWAAIWIWSHLTGQNPWKAPAWGEPPTEADRDSFRRWTKPSTEALRLAAETLERSRVPMPAQVPPEREAGPRPTDPEFRRPLNRMRMSARSVA
jgi:hypothetical protein